MTANFSFSNFTSWRQSFEINLPEWLHYTLPNCYLASQTELCWHWHIFSVVTYLFQLFFFGKKYKMLILISCSRILAIILIWWLFLRCANMIFINPFPVLLGFLWLMLPEPHWQFGYYLVSPYYQHAIALVVLCLPNTTINHLPKINSLKYLLRPAAKNSIDHLKILTLKYLETCCNKSLIITTDGPFFFCHLL